MLDDAGDRVKIKGTARLGHFWYVTKDYWSIGTKKGTILGTLQMPLKRKNKYGKKNRLCIVEEKEGCLASPF